MNFITRLVTTAVIIPLSLGPVAPPAEARGVCASSSITNSMQNYLAAGASPVDAWNWSVAESYSPNDHQCFLKTKGFAARMGQAMPRVYAAFQSGLQWTY